MDPITEAIVPQDGEIPIVVSLAGGYGTNMQAWDITYAYYLDLAKVEHPSQKDSILGHEAFVV